MRTIYILLALLVCACARSADDAGKRAKALESVRGNMLPVLAAIKSCAQHPNDPNTGAGLQFYRDIRRTMKKYNLSVAEVTDGLLVTTQVKYTKAELEQMEKVMRARKFKPHDNTDAEFLEYPKELGDLVHALIEQAEK